MMCLLRIFHDQIYGSQFKSTSWGFMPNIRWKPTQSTDPVTSPQRQPRLQNPAPLLTFPVLSCPGTAPGWRLPVPRVGYSELDQRRCPGQKVLKWVPEKWLVCIPVPRLPVPPIARARRKERLKPTLTPTLAANVQLVRVETRRIRRELQLVPQENGGIWGPEGLFSSLHSSPGSWREDKHRVHKIRTRH